MKSSPLALPITCALLVLWCLIAAAVGFTAPKPAAFTSEQTLRDDEGPAYFLEAVAMAKRALPDPEARWSQALVDGKTGCFPLGNGYWMAHGIVLQSSPGGIIPLTWEAAFVPGETEPRSLRIGNESKGDRNATLRAAISGPPVTAHE